MTTCQCVSCLFLIKLTPLVSMSPQDASPKARQSEDAWAMFVWYCSSPATRRALLAPVPRRDGSRHGCYTLPVGGESGVLPPRGDPASREG